jgi:hypothetical protein
VHDFIELLSRREIGSERLFDDDAAPVAVGFGGEAGRLDVGTTPATDWERAEDLFGDLGAFAAYVAVPGCTSVDHCNSSP